MKLKQMFLDQAGTGPSEAHQLSASYAVEARDEFVVQVAITGTATVQLEARLDASLPWAVVDTLSVSSISIYGRFPQVRLNVTANTGLVSAFIGD